MREKGGDAPTVLLYERMVRNESVSLLLFSRKRELTRNGENKKSRNISSKGSKDDKSLNDYITCSCNEAPLRLLPVEEKGQQRPFSQRIHRQSLSRR